MKRVIKRYENRKMYDATDGHHVSLSDIAALIQSGDQVKVIDNTNQKDITAQTLTQVILEKGKKGETLISSELLHKVIRWGGSVLDEGLSQIRNGIDEVLPKSLNELIKGERFKEIEQLKKRVSGLEKILNEMHSSEEDKSV